MQFRVRTSYKQWQNTFCFTNILRYYYIKGLFTCAWLPRPILPWVYNGNFSPVFERRKGRKNRGTYSCHGILRTFFLFISTHKISSPDHRTPLSKPLIFFFPSSSSTLLVYSYLTISSQIFENIPQNGPEYSHRNLASGYCGEKKHRGLAVLVGLIVKLSS